MPVTLKDIADKTGVSPSVVSTVLSGRDNGTFVSKETRDRVIEVARSLNYSPVRTGRPRGSRRLRNQHVEQFIGVWTPNFDTASAAYINALQKALAHYTAQREIVANATYDYGFRLLVDTDLPRIDMIGVMGLIVIGDTPIPRTAAAATMPVVLLGEVDDPPRETVTVHTDNFAAGRAVGSHLWQLGHRKVAYLASSAKASAKVTRQRWQGLQSVWVEQSALIEWCIPAPYDGAPNLSLREQIEKTIDGLVDNSKLSVTALICSSEAVALCALHALHDRGIKVPEDVSVTSFGDTPYVSDSAIPSLTTVKPPVAQIATTAIAQLYALHGESDQTPSFMSGSHHRDIGYPGELIIRNSTGKAPEIG